MVEAGEHDEELLQQMRQVIREQGWAVKGVGPYIAYTVGMTDAGLPELVLIGVPVEPAARVLNELARRSLDAELVPGRLYRVAEAARAFGVREVPAEPARRLMVYATAVYGDRWRVLEVLPELSDLPPTV